MASNWAIVIGINQYRFLQPLSYAKRDAEAMSEFLGQEARFDRIFLFTDDSPPIGDKITEPFRNNLLRVLRQIFAQPFMKDGDNFWFFFSGHGIRHNEQDYLMPLDGDPEDVEDTGISTQLVSSYLRSCGADNVVMILDACRSGGKKSGEGIGKQTEEEARQTGVISIFSCSPDQYSYELESVGQGAFTYALIEGLGIRGKCATVERLNQYLQSQVPQLVHQQLGKVRQTPYTIAEPIDRLHLILMPQHATLADIATLKNDAYNAQIDENWDVAERLWTRVLAAASGQDVDAIRALGKIAVKRNTEVVSPQPREEFQLPPSSQSSVSLSSKLLSLINQSSASPLWTRQKFLKWIVPTGIGIVGVTLSSRFLKDSLSQSSTSEPSKLTPIIEPASSGSNSSPSSDYSRLEELLKAGNWKEADQETVNVMLKIANREGEGWLNGNNIRNFPCDALRKIDQLWVQNSPDGKFGFSVQTKIYVEDCGGNPDGNYDEQAWNCFSRRVGWRVNGSWIAYRDVIFDTSAPKGHLPFGERSGWSAVVWGFAWEVFFAPLFIQRFTDCNIK